MKKSFETFWNSVDTDDIDNVVNVFGRAHSFFGKRTNDELRELIQLVDEKIGDRTQEPYSKEVMSLRSIRSAAQILLPIKG